MPSRPARFRDLDEFDLFARERKTEAGRPGSVAQATNGHGRARHIAVDLDSDPTDLMVTVRDDGVGFDRQSPLQDARGGMGLLSMRERVELLGGDFELRSAVGAGTTIPARLPI
jgi:signal transduction histidine kinase